MRNFPATHPKLAYPTSSALSQGQAAHAAEIITRKSTSNVQLPGGGLRG